MRSKEFTTKDIHKTAGLNVKPTDPRHPLYVQSIKRYTGMFSYDISYILHRMYRGQKFKPSEMFKTDIQMLDDIMYNHPLPSNIVVYHGTRENPLRLWKQHNVPLNKSILILLPAFTSTSTDVKKAITFSRREEIKIQEKTFIQTPYLKINVPAGTPALSVKQYSKHKNEDEILLGRGCVLEIKASLAGEIDKPNKLAKYASTPAEFPCKVVDVRPQELGFNETDMHLEEDSEFKFLGVV